MAFEQIHTIELMFQGLVRRAYSVEIMFVSESAKEADRDEFLELLLWLLAQIIGCCSASKIAGEYLGTSDFCELPSYLDRVAERFCQWRKSLSKASLLNMRGAWEGLLEEPSEKVIRKMRDEEDA